MTRRRWLLVLGGTLLAWGVAEALGAWLALSPPDVVTWATNPRAATMRHCPPNGMFCVTYRTNAQGLREPALVEPPRPGVLRIVDVGDSYTFGWGVEDDQTVPRRLQAHLSAAVGRTLEVINLGVPGGSPNSFLRLVNQYARALRPDIVVVNLFEIRNTVYGLDGADWPTLERDHLDQWIRRAEAPDPDPEAAQRRRLPWRSFVYRVGVRAWNVALDRGGGHRAVAAWPGPSYTRSLLPDDVARECRASEAPTARVCRADYPATLAADLRGREKMIEFWEVLKREGLIDAACRCVYSPTDIDRRIRGVMTGFDATLLTERRPAAVAQVRLSIAALARMQEWTRGFGARFYVVVWPNHARMLRVTPRQAADRFWLWSSDVFESPRLTDTILGLCRAYRLTWFNGVPAMRAWAAGRDPDTVFFKDRHFTALANDQFGRVLAGFLASEIAATESAVR